MREEIKDIIFGASVIIFLFGIVALAVIYDEKHPPEEEIYECRNVQGEIVYCKYVHEPTRREPLLYGDTEDGERVQITSYRRVERDVN